MDRFEISVRKFANRRDMSVKKVGKSALRLGYGFNEFLVVDVECVDGFILARTYRPFPVKPTPKNLWLINRLNCMFPNAKLVVDGYVRVCVSRKMKPTDLKSDRSLDDVLFTGVRWAEVFQRGLAMFAIGRHSDEEIVDEFRR